MDHPWSIHAVWTAPRSFHPDQFLFRDPHTASSKAAAHSVTLMAVSWSSSQLDSSFWDLKHLNTPLWLVTWNLMFPGSSFLASAVPSTYGLITTFNNQERLSTCIFHMLWCLSASGWTRREQLVKIMPLLCKYAFLTFVHHLTRRQSEKKGPQLRQNSRSGLWKQKGNQALPSQRDFSDTL